MGGFTPVVVGQTVRLAPTRRTTMQGQTIVCEDYPGDDGFLPPSRRPHAA
jgi:hypothetical protein